MLGTPVTQLAIVTGLTCVYERAGLSFGEAAVCSDERCLVVRTACSRQDWVWFATQGTDITIEMHEDKESDNRLRRRLLFLYLEMRNPLLAFAASVHHSIQGTVISQTSGNRLRALVHMVPASTPSSAKGGRTTITGQESQRSHGQFARILTAGIRYCLKVQDVFRRLPAQVAVIEIPASAPKDATASIFHSFELGDENQTHFLGAAAKLSTQEKIMVNAQCKELL